MITRKLIFILPVTILLLITSCLKNNWDLMILPKLGVIDQVANNQTFIELNCAIIKGQEEEETIFGFCLSKDSMPTIEDSIIFVEPLDNNLIFKMFWDINIEQDYYVRAFTKNKLGVSYSENQKKLLWQGTEENIPQISMISTDSVSYYFSDCQANITNDGGLPILEKGFIISENANPTMNNSMSYVCAINSLSFSNRNNGLNENTYYYVRAFVRNLYQTAFSQEILSFQTKNFYEIGETGPAGGKVFYSSIDGSTNWHFLETSSMDLDNSIPWSISNTSISGLSSDIGSGLSNTNIIISIQGTTANYASLQAIQHVENGYFDWFLPSRDELIKLIQAANLTGDYNLLPDYEYWSSSQDNSFVQNAWIVKYNNQSTAYTTNKLINKKVRLIRRF